MIRRLRIQGWRAFDEVTLDLTDGLTFVVAENGVGKTSLIQGAAWGLYGPLSRVDARAARRIGTPTTRVEIDVELPDGRTVAIVREAQERSESMYARIGATEIDENTLGQVLAQAYGASREFLSMTTILPSDAIADDGFHLQAHLRGVFGVDKLEKAADALQRLSDEADMTARKVRQASRRAAADRSRLRAALAEAESAEAGARIARTDARRVLDFAETQLSSAREQEAARANAAIVRQQFAEIVASSRRVLGRGARLDKVTQPAQLAARLEAAETAAADALDEHRREAATVAGRLAGVRAAAAALHAAEAECPVCRRDLTAGDVAHADDSHDREVNALLAQQRELCTQVESAARQRDELRALNRRVMRLPEIRSTDGDSPIDVEAAAFAVRAAAQEAERLDEESVLARTRRATLAAQVAEEEQNARDAEAAYRTHQREAVTSIAAEVVRATADAIVAERIDPLAAEIGQRWKRVFGERGSLQLRADGRLVLVRGIHEIPFTQFSSGEKVVALLATRLLVLGASTKASFLWLDEPLEHLDPRNRRITASLMSAAGPHVRQILVTTYEEGLARRLASATSAHLRYVRTPES